MGLANISPFRLSNRQVLSRSRERALGHLNLNFFVTERRFVQYSSASTSTRTAVILLGVFKVGDSLLVATKEVVCHGLDQQGACAM